MQIAVEKDSSRSAIIYPISFDAMRRPPASEASLPLIILKKRPAKLAVDHVGSRCDSQFEPGKWLMRSTQYR